MEGSWQEVGRKLEGGKDMKIQRDTNADTPEVPVKSKLECWKGAQKAPTESGEPVRLGNTAGGDAK